MKQSERVLVVGCGVIGLTSAIRLQEAGHRVTIVAREVPPHTTSDKAGAIWYPDGAQPADKVLAWGAASLDVLRGLMEQPKTGVSAVELRQVTGAPVALPAWAQLTGQAETATFPDYPAPLQHGFRVVIPFIDVPRYMPYLIGRFRHAGGRIEPGVLARPTDAAAGYGLIVNCTGVGARQFASDAGVFPKRGQTVRIAPTATPAVHVDEPGRFTYIFPRSGDVILGGTADVGDWRLEPDPAIAAGIIDACAALAPEVAAAPVLGHQVGLRPGRAAIRLERVTGDDGRPVIHNYGHGSIGHSLAWGCAADVAALERVMNYAPSSLRNDAP